MSQITDVESQASVDTDCGASGLPTDGLPASAAESKEPLVFSNSLKFPSHPRDQRLSQSQATDTSSSSQVGLLPRPPSAKDTLLLASKVDPSLIAASSGEAPNPKRHFSPLNWFKFDLRSRSTSAPVPADHTAAALEEAAFGFGDGKAQSPSSHDHPAARKTGRSGTVLGENPATRSRKRRAESGKHRDKIPVFWWEGRRFLSQDGTLLGIPDELRRNLLLASYLIYSTVMLFTVAFPSIGPSTFFCTVLSLPCVIAFLPNVDVVLAKTALRSFSTGYLFGNVAVLCVCLLVSSSVSVFSRIQIAYFFLLQTTLTAGMDASDIRTIVARISSCVYLVVGVVILLVKNSAWDPLVNTDSVWFGYFMDARRLANASAISCLFYAGRYMYNALRLHFSGSVDALCALRLPVRIGLERVHPEEIKHIQPFQPDSNRSKSVRRILDRFAENPTDHVEYVSLKTESISAFFMPNGNHDGYASSQSPRALHRMSESASASSNGPSHRKVPDVVERFFLFQPVITNHLLKRIANSKYYYVFLSVVLLVCFVFSAIDPPPNMWICPLLVVIVMCFLGCELTRFDRCLLGALARNFEYWLVVSSVVLHCSFNLVWKRGVAPIGQTAVYSFTLMFLVTSVVVYSLDAGPGYSYRLRLCVVSLLALSNFRFLISDTINPDTFPSELICFYYCASTRVLALSTMFTQAVFVFKFWVSLVRFKKRCIILSVGLEYCRMGDSSGSSPAIDAKRTPLP